MTTVERAPRHASPDIPKIALISWLGLESVLWSVGIGHLAKWAGNFAYFASVQVRYAVGYGNGLWTVWYLKDAWDRLPVHIGNLLGEHWFASQAAPEWWFTWRHDIRDVGIALAATIAVQFLFTKPRHPADDRLTVRQYVTAVPVALGAALIPIAIIGVLAWKLPWLQQHGWQVPASFGALASEVNGFIAAGTWITAVMGIAGGIAAKPFIRRVADDIQWFFAERSAGRIRSSSALGKLRGTRVIGTPAHRRRVRWLLDNRPGLPARNPWLVRGLLAAGFIVLAFAAAGAWLTLAGPAAVH
jgi:hypothetical protein